jgi:hypothetical protein
MSASPIANQRMSDIIIRERVEPPWRAGLLRVAAFGSCDLPLFPGAMHSDMTAPTRVIEMLWSTLA